ncbi:hypothetical protein F4778DRAFT_279326 [Xylariomycetidae sp. FL2044]|nr:hypothetical protein F4778DRAFT_279326 [Xylariomycetidae sp. FL2044]
MFFFPGPASNGFGSIRFILALTPIVIPAAYIYYLQRSFAARTVTTGHISHFGAESQEQDAEDLHLDHDHTPSFPLPHEIRASRDEYVIARERIASHLIPIPSLIRPALLLPPPPPQQGPPSPPPAPDPDPDPDLDVPALLTAYLRTTLRLFSCTPQAFIMKYMMIADADAKATFSAPYLANCDFAIGDRVCGVYVVAARADGRAVLSLQPPGGWKGPVATGLLSVGFDVVEEGGAGDDGGKGEPRYVRAVNETVLWRSRHQEPSVLESRAGRAVHGFMVRWMVLRGVEAITQN